MVSERGKATSRSQRIDQFPALWPEPQFPRTVAGNGDIEGSAEPKRSEADPCHGKITRGKDLVCEGWASGQIRAQVFRLAWRDDRESWSSRNGMS